MSAPTTVNGSGSAVVPAAGSSAPPAATDASSNASSAKPAVQASEVGWLFVPQYYTFLNQNPGRLHCFYTKKSTLIHGTEQKDDAAPCYGQQQIHDKIVSLGFEDCKVFVSNVDSQSSAAGGIVIQVLGEMSNKGGPWRKFAQTFFLAEQPHGYFVLNDIFRFLKDEDEVEEEAEEVDEAVTQEIDEAEARATEVGGANKVDISAVKQPSAAPQVKSITPAPSDGAPPAVDAPSTTEAAAPAKSAPAAALGETAKPDAPAQGAAKPASEQVKEEGAVEAVKQDAAEASTVTKPQAGDSQDVAAGEVKAPAAGAGEASAPSTTPAAAGSDGTATTAQTAPAVSVSAPAAPKTWANLAASDVTRWGSTASEAKGVSTTRPAAPAPPAKSTPSGASRTQSSTAGPSAALLAAQSQSHAGVFIKNVIMEQMPPEGLQASLEARFGTMKECHIIASRACAFGEFASVEAARKAIIMSLRPSDGGEGGVPVGDKGWTVTIEEKRKPSDRPPRASQGDRGGSHGRGGGGGRGGRGRGGSTGRGRGGAPSTASG